MDRYKLNEQAGAVLVRGNKRFHQHRPFDMLNLSGHYKTEHWRKGKLIGIYEAKNLITNVGKNYILDTMFHSGTQIVTANWYLGLISNSGYSAISATDTMASHSGWTEFVAVDEAARQAWGPGAASGQSITNASAVTYTINATGTVKGIFIVGGASAATDDFSGTTGTLWSAALYTGGDVAVVDDDQLRSTYTLNT